MTSRLLPCPSCARHVRASESTCPFCTSALAFAPAPLPRTAAGRLSRAALFALGTTAVAACRANTSDIYGGPPPDAGQEDAPIAQAVYGGPPVDPPDAGAPKDGGSD